MLSQSLLDCHKTSCQAGKPLALKVFVCGRNRQENEGAIALAQAFKVNTLKEIMDANGIKVLVDLLTLAHLHTSRATVPLQV